MSSLSRHDKNTHTRLMRTVRTSALPVLVGLLLFVGTVHRPAVSRASDIEITGPDVQIGDNHIRVTTSLSLNDKLTEELRNGATKEFKFSIDLFRVWKMWPDEFVSGKSLVRTVKADPITMEYRATSNDGITITQKKFKSFDSMIQWALLIDDLKIAQVSELEKSTYFVRVTVESKIRKLPPVIGYFMIFLPENEFSIRKDSPPFLIGARK